MKEQPLVSVLMTAYNREKYIAEAIESVMASTYDNWELIIVDDRSKDRTVEIARSYAEKDKRIKVFVNEKNLGDYPNRNKAASYAKGKYLKYVDADDMIYPYGLEQLVFYMEQFPEAGYGLCSLEQDTDRIYPFMLSPQEAYHRHYIEKKWLFHKAPLSSIIKRDVFEKAGGFPVYRQTSDFEMWNRLSQKYNVVLMPHGIVWYRVHENQEYQQVRKNPSERLKYLLKQKEMLSLKDCPLKEKDKAMALEETDRSIARYILRHLKSYGLKIANQLRKQANLSWKEVLNNAL